MANIVFIAASLDGYIATKDGGIEWLNDIPNPENSDFGYQAFCDRIDGIVMGRNTFEKVLSFAEWPYPKTVFILSNRLSEIPPHLDRSKIEIVKGDLIILCEQLKERGYQNLYIDGGITIQNFLQQDLIDEMIIANIPILLGNGHPLFGYLDCPLKFRHAQTEIYSNGIVQSYYIRDRIS